MMNSREDAPPTSQSTQEAISRIRAALDSRQEARVPTKTEVKIRSLGPEKTDPHVGFLIDLSRSGLRLRTSVQHRIGSRIDVIFDDFCVVAEVRYCREMEFSSYDIGAQIEQLNELPG